jgi:N-acetylglucosaminyl-diphospho-decaprenol L-rhamnosyltransferase
MNPLSVHFIVHHDFSHIHQALQSLAENTSTPHDVYVTINAGAAEEIERLKVAFPQARITVNANPAGFAANHNAFMRRAETPYVALLNNDIFIHPGALDRLIAYLDSHSDVALVGPGIQNPDGTTQISAYSDPTLLRMLYTISGLGRFTPHGGCVRTALQRSGLTRLIGTESLQPVGKTRCVPVVVGVAMVARRAAYLQAGLLDEHTIIYGEEYGWHWRLRSYGWKVALVTEAQVTHYSPKQDLSGWKLAEHRKSILSYYQRYRPAWQMVVIRLSIIVFHTLYALVLWPFNRAVAASHWQTVRMGRTWHSTDSLSAVIAQAAGKQASQ